MAYFYSKQKHLFLEALNIEGTGMPSQQQQSYLPQLGGLQLGPGSQYPLAPGAMGMSGGSPFSQQPSMQYQDSFFMPQMVQHGPPVGGGQMLMGGFGEQQRAGSMAPIGTSGGDNQQTMIPGTSGIQAANQLQQSQAPALPQFFCPPRPNHGVEGRAIVLRYFNF